MTLSQTLPSRNLYSKSWEISNKVNKVQSIVPQKLALGEPPMLSNARESRLTLKLVLLNWESKKLEHSRIWEQHSKT